MDRPVGLMVKASASRAGSPRPDSSGDFSGSRHTSDEKLALSGFPSRRLGLKGQRWDWLAPCQYTVIG